MPSVEPRSGCAPRRDRLLCVDDEQLVLEGLSLQLGRMYEVVTALSGPEGLEALERHGPFAVVLSDMRMPHMSGAEFLAQVRQRAPDSTRMLLTGQIDFDAAVEAVNEGHIFRLLVKPCDRNNLLRAVSDAVVQHRLVLAERELLEQTYTGSLAVLGDVLAVANPKLFGRLATLRHTVRCLAQAELGACAWELEAATTLAEIGCVTLPPAVVDRAGRGELTPGETHQLARVPGVGRKLVAHLPRLEQVNRILDELETADREIEIAQPPGDVSDARRLAVVLQRARGSRETPSSAAALRPGAETQEVSWGQGAVVEVTLRTVPPGAMLVEPVFDEAGQLLAPAGALITPALIERLQNVPDEAATARIWLPRRQPTDAPDGGGLP